MQPPTNQLSLRERTRLSHLIDCLADPDCTDWTCPNCGRIQYKGATNAETGAFIPFALECEECGFDATEFAPAGGAAHSDL